MKQLKRPFKVFRKATIIITFFYLVLSLCAIILTQQHVLQTDTDRALARVDEIQDSYKVHEPLSLDNSIKKLPNNTSTAATRAINHGASYAQVIHGKEITVTIPLNQNGQRVAYLSATTERTSTAFYTFIIVGLSLIFWLISIIGNIRRSATLSNYTENTVAKIKNIERSPLTQSYLITTDEDAITTALNHLGEQIQQRIVSGQETKESLYEFIEFFQFPIFVYDGRGSIHQSNAAFKNEFSDLTSIDGFSQYTAFLNFLVDKMVHPDIQDKTFYFNRINSYYQVTFNPLEMVQGRYLVLMNDVSQYHQIIQSHTDFIENISKAFKEPLQRVEKRINHLAKENNPEMLQIKKDLNWLDALVSDTLLLSQPVIRTKKTDFKLSNMLQKIINNFQPSITKKSLNLVVELTKDNEAVSEIIIHTEAEKLRVILTKLLQNAISYTPSRGTVKILINQTKRQTNISIVDTGPGLTKLQQSRIFERFYRTDAGKSNNNGTGLGLAIVQRNVQELKGHIQVTSQVEQGTTFTVTL